MWDESQKAQESEEKEKKENEFNEMTSFFRDSWLQVPDRKSPSRSMKPQCVVGDAIVLMRNFTTN